jgi:hypothetical protein
MFDELWSEIQDSQGEIFDIPKDFLSQIYEAEKESSDYGVGK